MGRPGQGLICGHVLQPCYKFTSIQLKVLKNVLINLLGYRLVRAMHYAKSNDGAFLRTLSAWNVGHKCA